MAFLNIYDLYIVGSTFPIAPENSVSVWKAITMNICRAINGRSERKMDWENSRENR